MGNKYDNMEAAISYDRSLKIVEDGKKRVAGMQLSPEMKVLDIGSGPGILAIPLAKRVREVTVVEPSEAMRTLLKRHMREEHITNIRILPYLWEEVPEEELETYDLVIASYSLNMPDFKEALLKMNRHSCQEVMLYWFAGETSWERDARILRERLGESTPVKQHRKTDVLYRTLYQEGIYCNVTVLQNTSFDREYSTFELAVADMKKRYDIAERDVPVLAAYLEERLEQTASGWCYRDRTHYVRMSWKAAKNLQREYQ